MVLHGSIKKFVKRIRRRCAKANERIGDKRVKEGDIKWWKAKKEKLVQ